jgi:L-proline amide hydrolase
VEEATGTYFEWDGHRTWRRVIGEITPDGPTPAIICHGGPGATHDYLEPMAGLAASGRPCVFYDQLGNGHSEHLPDVPSDFWTPELFQRELVALAADLGIASGYHVVGQSWGGMLAMLHALEHPSGLRSITVCNSPASMRLWVAEANRLRADLPPDVQATLLRHEADETTDSPEYKEAMLVFYERHVCRFPVAEWPAFVTRSFDAMDSDPTVYHTMNGPSEFHTIGSLLDWNITDRLSGIDVPTLLISGEFDEATPHIVEQIHTRIPGARWELVAGTSHLTHVEEPEIWLALVGAFLDEVDARQPAGG